MKKTITVLLLFAVSITKGIAQQDTIYFNDSWHKVNKDVADFYRPIPLKKVGDLYEVKDYYINGNLQMEAYSSSEKEDVFEGLVKWFYDNGQLSIKTFYTKGIPNGETLGYSKKGYVRAKGIYKNNKNWSGTILSNCCNNGYTPEYKDGKKIGHYSYHEDSNQIALHNVIKNDSTNIINYFDKKGKKTGDLTLINQLPIEGIFISYHFNKEFDVIEIESYSYYKNGKINGEAVTYTKDGVELGKGIYKDNKPYSGTTFRQNTLKTYVAGKLEGEEIGYSSEMKPITKGINKNNKHWEGQFKEDYNHRIESYKNGEQVGKQVYYFTNKYQQVKLYRTILKNSYEGESISYDKEGKELAKGIYKNDKPYNGTFLKRGYNKTFSSYKNGKKHGIFITYDNKDKIISQQEFEDDKITGKVITKTSFQDNDCNCIYKKGEPYTGIVCKEYSITHYQDGFLTKKEEYKWDYDLQKTIPEVTNSFNDQGNVERKTLFIDDKSYTLTFKNGEPYTGISYSNEYSKELITYKNGKKEGAFSNLENDSRYLVINGTYKNDLWDGEISFHETQLDKKTSCVYKKGKPINGTVIEDGIFTTYKKGKKHGVEKEINFTGNKEQIERVTEYNKGAFLTTTWPNKKNNKDEITKGTYKKNQPYNGYFLDFKPKTASLTHYKKGIITGNQYHGYNEDKELVITDTLQYKAGKPYQGKLPEHHNDNRFHIHEYDKGTLIKTSITRDKSKRGIERMVTYTNNGFLVYQNTDFLISKATYLNEAKTKVKVVYNHDEFSGFVEYYNNKISAIDINFNESLTRINYSLVNNKLLITLQVEGIDDFHIKAYPKIEEISYKSFLDPEELFMDGEVLMETYIDNKKVAKGIMINTDMHDGIHIRPKRLENTYLYYEYNKGKRIHKKTNLTKEALLKLLKTKH